MTHSRQEHQASDKGMDHKAARQSKTARAAPFPKLDRIGRSWVDGNGELQNWTACSEIHQMAWFARNA